MKTLLLLSGGMDSVAIAWWKRPDMAITVDYGQVPAEAEIRAACAVTETLGIEHHVVRCDLSALGSGDMAGRAPLDIAPVSEMVAIPKPVALDGRSHAVGFIGSRAAADGCLSTDGQHADGTAGFIAAINSVFSLQEARVVVEAPAIALTAVGLIQQSGIPFEVLAWAHSCHCANESAGICRGCLKHYNTMQALGHDPY